MMLPAVVGHTAAVRINIRVRPGASRTRVGGEHDGALVVRVGALASDGRATDAALAAVADAFGVRRSAVTLVLGATSRSKIIQIAGASVQCWMSCSRNSSTSWLFKLSSISPVRIVGRPRADATVAARPLRWQVGQSAGSPKELSRCRASLGIDVSWGWSVPSAVPYRAKRPGIAGSSSANRSPSWSLTSRARCNAARAC